MSASIALQSVSSPIETVARLYPVRVSSFVSRLITEGRYCEAAARQYEASAEELYDPEGFVKDACNELSYRRGRALIHKYHNRAALMLTNRCFVYCRFCFRKAIVGQPDTSIKPIDLKAAIDYLTEHPEICDVLLTGGDPLLIGNNKLFDILDQLERIPSLAVIRFDSRALNTSPERFDSDLIARLRQSKKIWYHAHLNHPDDLNQPEVLEVVSTLVSAGVPLMNQFVLLRGVNDSPEIIESLLMSCYSHRIIPYNMYLPDKVKGTSHFRVRQTDVIDILSRISDLPGPAQPALVVVDKENKKQRMLLNEHMDVERFLANYYA